MKQTTFVETRGVAHKGSNGMSIVFPDVCKTPVGPSVVPIPYPNIGFSMHTAMGPMTVKTDGQMPMVKGSMYPMSTGDEPGVALGVASNMIKGQCEFMLYSFFVKFEGKNACRMGDPLFHNKKNAMG